MVITYLQANSIFLPPTVLLIITVKLKAKRKLP